MGSHSIQYVTPTEYYLNPIVSALAATKVTVESRGAMPSIPSKKPSSSHGDGSLGSCFWGVLRLSNDKECLN